MHYGKMKMSILLSVALIVVPFTLQAVTPLPSYHHICLDMANGARYNDSGVAGRACSPIAFEQYYHKFDGYGLNELHITTDFNNADGTSYVTDAQSGTFYITTTGGRGSNEEVILLVSINRTEIPPITTLHLQSSGYQIVTSSVSPFPVISSTFISNALNATFTAADFIYGPQTWKPSGSASYPLWFGQDVSDASTQSLLMFVDLNVGNADTTQIPGATYNGAVRVDYSFTALTNLAGFNAYSWCRYSNQGQGISWTNQTDGTTGYSGYVVNPPAQWGATEAEAASGTGARTGGAAARDSLLMLLIPVALVICWKFASKGSLRVRQR